MYSHLGLTWMPAGLGVLAFFVLSGFLITWLLLKEHERYGSISLRLFYIRRSLTIFPAFYVYAAIVIGGLLVVGGRIVWPQVAASLLYVNNYYQAIYGDPNTGLSHTWSLGVEEQFYLLWPVVFVSLLRRPQKGWQMAHRSNCSRMGVSLRTVSFRCVAGVHLRSVRYTRRPSDDRMSALRWRCGIDGGQDSGARCVRMARCPPSRWRCWPPRRYAPSRTPGYRETVGFIVEPLLVGVLIVQWIAMGESGAWG